MLPICSDEESIASLSLFSPARQQGALSNYGAVISIRSIADRLIVIHSSLEVCYYRWNSFPDGEGNPFTIRAEKSKVLPCAQSSLSEEILRISVTPKPRRSSIVDSLVDTANSILVEPDRLESIGIPADSAPPLNKDRNSIHLKDDDEEIERNSNSNRSSLSAASNKVFDMFRRSFKTFGSPDSASSPFTSNVSPRASLKDGLVDTKFVFDAKNNAPSTQEIRSSDKLFNGLSDDSLDEVPEDVEPVSVPKLAVKRLSHQYVTVCAADALQSRIVTCGYWDNSLKVHSVESLKEVDSCSSGHLGSINCVTQGHQSSHTLITGGQDGTCRIWVLEKPAVAAAFTEDSYFSNKTSQDETTTDQAPLVCVRVLWGHRSPVTSISYSADLDILLSGASDGLLCVHSVGRGKFIRSIKHMMGTSADLVLASSAGYLISHSWSDLQLHLFWLNGQHLISISLPYRLEKIYMIIIIIVMLSKLNHANHFLLFQ